MLEINQGEFNLSGYFYGLKKAWPLTGHAFFK